MSSTNLPVETLHVCGLERRVVGAHFVEDTTDTPNVALVIIRLVLPDLWTSVIRGTSLGL